MKNKGKIAGIVILAVLIAAFGYRFTHLHGKEKEPAKAEEQQEAGKKEEKEEHEPKAVTLDAEKQKQAGVVVATAAPEKLPGVISATGKIEADADRVAHVSPRIAGKVIAVSANLGDSVGRGQIVTRLESVELADAVNRYRQSASRLSLARKNLDRVTALVEKKIAARKEIFQAETEYQSALSENQADRERLQSYGVAAEAATRSGGRLILPVTSPIAGVVTEKHVMVGELADPSKNLFTVADLSTVWVMVDVNEKDVAKVHTGQKVVLTVGAFPDRTFGGRITYIADVVDEATRTVKARVQVQNPRRMLKPEMFATAEIDLPPQGNAVLAVPEEALQEIEGKKVIFVTADGATFAPRPVSTGTRSSGKVEIAAGLKEGEKYAAKGSFLLKSELLKGELGEE